MIPSAEETMDNESIQGNERMTYLVLARTKLTEHGIA
jgi:hypothetical protein